MIKTYPSALIIIAFLFITSCGSKKKEEKILETTTEKTINPPIQKNEETIEGLYISTECDLSLEITKTKEGYAYFFKTNARKVKGKANFTQNESGESYITLEGIQWDDYEGDISNQEDTDSIPSKELEIPIGIYAGYVRDTLTIQNYGNAMNSYTKISECGSKYIQLIKK